MVTGWQSGILNACFPTDLEFQLNWLNVETLNAPCVFHLVLVGKGTLPRRVSSSLDNGGWHTLFSKWPEIFLRVQSEHRSFPHKTFPFLEARRALGEKVRRGCIPEVHNERVLRIPSCPIRHPPSIRDCGESDVLRARLDWTVGGKGWC
jgi:hypothetical protein